MIVRTASRVRSGAGSRARASYIPAAASPASSLSSTIFAAPQPLQRPTSRTFASSALAPDDSASRNSQLGGSTSGSSSSSSSSSSAAYLLEQALKLEEEEERVLEAQKRGKKPKELQEDAWDGDEPQHRAIRRILEDQYKPLRVKGHVKKIPQPAPLCNSLFADRNPSPPPSAESSAPKEPWQVKFKAPDHYQSDIRTADSSSLPPPISGTPSSSLRSRGVARPQRIAQAWERSLDYGAGFRPGGLGERVMVPDENAEEGGERRQEGRRAMGGMRAWDGIVEDKIQQARRDGLFKHVKGRGKPILRDLEAESNPYIKRDDFLINRVIKQQGVAPPWIELQQELEISLRAFRQAIRENWIRRATRMQSLGGVTAGAIREVEEGWRDKEWEAEQESYHTVSINAINSTVRRYNVVAPYSARRGLHSVNAEVAACVKACIPAISWELQRRLDGGRVSELPERRVGEKGEALEEPVVEQKAADDRFWPALRRGVFELLGVGVEQRK
ncbi:hypothetical protein BCR35DRAFT_355727 [Leucosporidium creatinivorum]|uniref:DnaJ homologue subfamily C member 28 conserved domain-containing protein n=1 Tax=Leucosporidium creatinivorum TaxID=106004 RepID=A0A1Y2D8I0_9BASI|nr:hypothetical protein BCR35DRAFT_355727 [Leucosporidium creatinivorum]